ncbi:MAG: metallophosphoesterase [Gemmatimonadaceae bacterium]
MRRHAPCTKDDESGLTTNYMAFRDLTLGMVLGCCTLGCARTMEPHAPAPATLELSPDVETALYLIGDAGAPNLDREPVFIALDRMLAVDPSRSVVVFLGDNVYPRGLPDSTDEEYSLAAARLDAQVSLVRQRGARGYFVPGNHDWAHWGPDGWEAIKRQAQRVNNLGGGVVTMHPTGGCPGPDTVAIGRQLLLVMIDSQWWLQSGPKPTNSTSGCAAFTSASAVRQIREAIANAGDRHVVVAAHHPYASGGAHGGFAPWRQYFLLGFPIWRKLWGYRQDLGGHPYEVFRDELASAFAEQPPLVYAAGHEHTQQVIANGPARYQLVSGAGIYNHEGPVTSVKGTRLASSQPGFMRLDFYRDRRVRLGVFAVDQSGEARVLCSSWIDASRSMAPCR